MYCYSELIKKITKKIENSISWTCDKFCDQSVSDEKELKLS